MRSNESRRRASAFARCGWGRNNSPARDVIRPMSAFRSVTRTVLPAVLLAAASIAFVLGLLPAILAAAAEGL
ncbi:MAG: hypothetical protein H6Q36_251 [Chloroflexi bacterium]|nr:hypothetical protein [Chloroflexota bacterium]